MSGKTKDDFGHGQASFITYMNVYSNPVSRCDMVEPIEIDNRQNEVEIGDVFFTTSSETPEEVGMTSVLTEKKGIIYLNSFCFGFRPFEKIDKYYLAYMLRSKNTREKIVLLAQGISRYNISKNKAMEIFIELPSLDEQVLIGKNFQLIDHLITLHQSKSFGHILKIIAGYTLYWEQRKLEEIGNTYSGLSGKTKDDFGHGQASFITYMNVYSNPVSRCDMVEPIEIDNRQNEVEIGDVFFTTSSETPEEVGMTSVLTEKKGIIYLNSFCFGFRPFEKIDKYYLAYMLRSKNTREKIVLLAQGISRYNISKNKAMEIFIELPSLDEQVLIGKNFQLIDHLITLHQLEPFKLIFKAIAYRIIDYAKSKPPRYIKYTDLN